jgi:hypothetical protein
MGSWVIEPLTHDDIGDVLLTQGDLTGAIAAFKASLDVKQALADAAPHDAGRRAVVFARSGGSTTRLHINNLAVLPDLPEDGRLGAPAFRAEKRRGTGARRAAQVRRSNDAARLLYASASASPLAASAPITTRNRWRTRSSCGVSAAAPDH